MEGREERVAALERHIANLELVHTHLETCLRKRRSAAQQARNSFLPISQLPVELLLFIFAAVLDEATPLRTYYKALGKIALTCTSFSNLIGSSPHFWTRISPDCSEHLIQRALAKSRDNLLAIERPLHVSSTSSTFLDSIFGQGHRIHSLDLLFEAYVRPTIAFHPTPSLKRLTLRAGWHRRGCELVELRDLDAPRLQRITLQGTPLMMVGQSFPDLRSLVMTNLDSDAPTVSTLLEIFSNSPLLETLALRKINFPIEETPHHKSRVELLHLTKLKLDLVQPGVLATFLDQVQTPNCTEVRIRCKPPSYRPEQSTIEYLDASLTQFSSLLTRPHDGDMEIHLGTKLFHCHIGGVYVTLETPDPYKWLEWVAGAVDVQGTMHRCTLVLQAGIDLSDRTLYSWLDKLPCVTSLHVKSRRKQQDIFEHLGRPTRGDDAEERWWLLPKMDSLYVKSRDKVFDSRPILSMVPPRCSTPNVDEEGGDGKRRAQANGPVRIRKLDLSGARNLEGKVYADLQSMLGKGNVVRHVNVRYFYDCDWDSDEWETSSSEEDWED